MQKNYKTIHDSTISGMTWVEMSSFEECGSGKMKKEPTYMIKYGYKLCSMVLCLHRLSVRFSFRLSRANKSSSSVDVYSMFLFPAHSFAIRWRWWGHRWIGLGRALRWTITYAYLIRKKMDRFINRYSVMICAFFNSFNSTFSSTTPWLKHLCACMMTVCCTEACDLSIGAPTCTRLFQI